MHTLRDSSVNNDFFLLFKGPSSFRVETNGDNRWWS